MVEFILDSGADFTPDSEFPAVFGFVRQFSQPEGSRFLACESLIDSAVFALVPDIWFLPKGVPCT